MKFTYAATHDSFMLAPCSYSNGEIVAMDRAYICYEKFEELTEKGVFMERVSTPSIYRFLSHS